MGSALLRFVVVVVAAALVGVGAIYSWMLTIAAAGSSGASVFCVPLAVLALGLGGLTLYLLGNAIVVLGADIGTWTGRRFDPSGP